MSHKADYQWWQRTVLAARRKHDATMARFRAFALPDTDDATLASIIDRLVKMRKTVTEQCKGTWKQRVALLGTKEAAARLNAFIVLLQYFLSEHERFARYNVTPSDLNVRNFTEQIFVDTLCSRLRRGINRELSYAVRRRMTDWLAAIPIGGREPRRYNVDAIVDYVLERRLEQLTPDEIYAEYGVFQKQRDIAAALPELESDAELAVEQFEFIGGSGKIGETGSLSESVFAPTQPKAQMLTRNNLLCKSECKLDRKRNVRTCETDRYFFYGLPYEWDYC